MTQDQLLYDIVKNYLESKPINTMTPSAISSGLIDTIQLDFQLKNAARAKGAQYRIPKKLAPAVIAEILLTKESIRNLALAGLDGSDEFDILGIYQTSGENEGIYVTDQNSFRRLIREYDFTIDDKGISQVLSILRISAERVSRCADKDLIAVNNGIFNFKSKKLLPFDPNLVFISKSKVNYNPNSINPVIHNPNDGTDWDIESWMTDLFDDPEREKLVWEIIGAVLRPMVPWNKSAWFLSETGNNGKGTLCELMRQLLGSGTHTSISLLDFAKEFMLTPLITANAVITDENSVGIYVDSADNLKAAITGDVLLINRKFKDPVAIRFHGMIIQCVNEVPRVRDRSASFMRRFLIVPFNKCFTGRERKYIKENYLKRQDVLEYVLYKVLNMDYYELSHPTACKTAMEEFRLYNGPIEQFASDLLPQCRWHLLPNEFLYDLYRAWMDRYCPSGIKFSKIQFLKELKIYLKSSPDWEVLDTPRDTGDKMNAAEPLIAEYKLERWFNPVCRGDDVEKMCHPVLKTSYRGILRK